MASTATCRVLPSVGQLPFERRDLRSVQLSESEIRFTLGRGAARSPHFFDHGDPALGHRFRLPPSAAIGLRPDSGRVASRGLRKVIPRFKYAMLC